MALQAPPADAEAATQAQAEKADGEKTDLIISVLIPLGAMSAAVLIMTGVRFSENLFVRDDAIGVRLRLAHFYQQASDHAFARGDGLLGFRLYRSAVAAVDAAEELAKMQATRRP